ncbi:MAG: EAL domain-containing protein [Gammaproteobacteria bacterium]|jgi:EAL domain-containing protein (putative c-di-GMP-specific phosphodiesterase class I)/CRP-like cAMP-binding protein|nr:EAL domain-containing protein [Gammaproteobacteria bacterium]
MDSSDSQTSFDTDEFIFREGDPGDCAYIIESGMVEVTLDKDGRKLVMATLTKGDILGEMAIIDRLPRSASARAIVPTDVMAIPLDYVSQKIEQSDPTVRMFLRLAMARYRDLNARLGRVFEGLSLGQLNDEGDGFAASTMELKSLIPQFLEMHKRIDSAVTKPAQSDSGAMFGEKTLEITKLLVTEDKMLQAAMTKKEFRLHYQPIVDLSNNKIVGCEALVRWSHPSGELLLPSRFLTHVENSDLIIDLGYWIAEQACDFQSRLCNDFQHDIFVAINLSGKQFEDQFLVPSLADIMDKTGARRERIKFEVTESLLIDNPELATQSLHQLKETGAKLAIDDFGTGYSSFSYLHRFPFDTLKIDRVFVSAMARSEKSNQIVKSLVNLSHDLGMDVVAEGIETEQEAELMRGFQTAFGQGFYYSKPVNETEFVKLLQKPQMELESGKPSG